MIEVTEVQMGKIRAIMVSHYSRPLLSEHRYNMIASQRSKNSNIGDWPACACRNVD
jgi:hypothetical protein